MFKMSPCRCAFLLVGAVTIVFRDIQGAAPSGCTLDETDASTGIYKCDMNSSNPPLAMSSFSSPIAQRLKLYNVNGDFVDMFSGFESYDNISHDTNYAASLEIECTSSGTLNLTDSSFSNMSHIQVFKITNCAIAVIPANAFAQFTNLDYFLISGGTIAGLDGGSLTSMVITKQSIPNPRGEFAIINSVITGGLVSGFLDPLTTVKTITLDNVGLDTLSTSTFSKNKAVRHLSLANNLFTSVPDNVFTGLDGLSSLDMTGLKFACTCNNVWILSYASGNNIDFTGSLVCHTPSSHKDKRASQFESDSCPQTDACNGTPGVPVGSSCLMAYQIASYVVLFVTLILSCMALGLVCHTRKQLINNENKPKFQKPRSWNRVQFALKRVGGAGQKPPANIAVLKGKGWV